jgi:hypothetical protein
MLPRTLNCCRASGIFNFYCKYSYYAYYEKVPRSRQVVSKFCAQRTSRFWQLSKKFEGTLVPAPELYIREKKYSNFCLHSYVMIIFPYFAIRCILMHQLHVRYTQASLEKDETPGNATTLTILMQFPVFLRPSRQTDSKQDTTTSCFQFIVHKVPPVLFDAKYRSHFLQLC